MQPLKQAVKELRENGYILARHGGKHDVYFNKTLGLSIMLKRHDFDESDLRYIRKEIKQNLQGEGR